MGASIDVRDLARAAAAGDQHGWDGLVERFGELVWSTIRAYGLSPGKGADAAQTTWLLLAEQLGQLEDQHERLGVWLAATARRESLRLLGAGAPSANAASNSAPATEPAAGAADDPPQQGRDALLWRVVRELPDHCRRLLRVLLTSPPPSHEEVSAALDLPVAGIAAARDACLQDFRHRMSDFSIRNDADGS
jgi:DNA-directed RNA polymerase specialized sigma24 family protein